MNFPGNNDDFSIFKLVNVKRFIALLPLLFLFVKVLAQNDSLNNEPSFDDSNQFAPVSIDTNAIEISSIRDKNDSANISFDRQLERKSRSTRKHTGSRNTKPKNFSDTNILKILPLPYLHTWEGIDSVIEKSQVLPIDLKVQEIPWYALSPHLKVFTEIDSSTSNNYDYYLDSLEKFRRAENIIKLRTSGDWLIGIIIVSLILLGWSKLFFNKYLNQVFSSLFNYNLAYSLFKDSNSMLSRLSIILNALFSINLALFLTQVFDFYSIDPFNYGQFLYFLLFFALIPTIYFFKRIFILLSGIIFSNSEINREYIYNFYLINKILGVFLFPFIVTIPYINELVVPYLIKTGIFLIVICYILRLFRGIQIIFQKSVSILYLILYFCTLEILPMFWLYKFVILLI